MSAGPQVADKTVLATRRFGCQSMITPLRPIPIVHALADEYTLLMAGRVTPSWCSTTDGGEPDTDSVELNRRLGPDLEPRTGGVMPQRRVDDRNSREAVSKPEAETVVDSEAGRLVTRRGFLQTTAAAGERGR